LSSDRGLMNLGCEMLLAAVTELRRTGTTLAIL
jgi:hypothetical protein